MGRMVYLSGRMVPKEEATISVFDHGLLYGDGVFEGIRVYGGKVFLLEAHIRRLYDGAGCICLDIPMDPEVMCQAVRETVAANADLTDGYIRLIVTRGIGTLGLNPRLCTQGQVIIIYDTISLYPEELYRHGLEIVTARTVRNNPNALPPRVKSLNYLNNILAKIEGLEADSIEALMLNHRGEVAEATGDNVFIVAGGTVKTPSLDAGILEGITRDAVIDLAKELGYPVVESALKLDELKAADECFLTGTAAEVIPVVKVDGQKIGSGTPGAVTMSILKAYRQMTRGE